MIPNSELAKVLTFSENNPANVDVVRRAWYTLEEAIEIIQSEYSIITKSGYAEDNWRIVEWLARVVAYTAAQQPHAVGLASAALRPNH